MQRAYRPHARRPLAPPENALAGLSPAEQADVLRPVAQEHAHMIAKAMGMARGGMLQTAFFSTFSPFDILWFVLALGTAFKFGSGSGDDA